MEHIYITGIFILIQFNSNSNKVERYANKYMNLILKFEHRTALGKKCYFQLAY